VKQSRTVTTSARVDGHHLRPEIQALRAVAVMSVVVYHLEPRLLPGGYVGVDVFFVISGFLITSHIVRGLLDDSFSLGQFYWRRARRLLPASLLVLAVAGALCLAFAPLTLWNTTGREILASVGYVQNWVLASAAVDYLAAGNSASAVQHFWSLSVEEQFYLFWPALLLVTARLSRGRRRAALTGVVLAVVVASLAYSVYLTAHSPSWAYFVTTTRIWELGVGGLLALLVPVLKAPAAVRAALSWAGLTGIAVACLTFSGASAFPGYIALLPVLSAAACIAAGDVPGRWSPAPVANLRVVQLVGDISYSIYLWHWPFIKLVPLVIGGPGYELPKAGRVLVVLASLPVAWLSKRYVEDRFRGGPRRIAPAGDARPATRRDRFVPVLAGAMVLTLALGGTAFAVSSVRIAQARVELDRFLAAWPECAGAEALHPRCQGRAPQGVTPSPLIATRDAIQQRCQQLADRSALIRCQEGSTRTGAPTLLVVGDSHANQWMPAIRVLAGRHGWRVVTYFKSGCAFGLRMGTPSCQEFDDNLARALTTERFDAVITSARSDGGFGSHLDTEAAAASFEAAWRPLAARAELFVIADTPQPFLAGLLDPPSCVMRGDDCTLPVGPATSSSDALRRAAAAVGGTYLDLTDAFCTGGRCPSVVGGVLVYRDRGHITATYARSLADALDRKLGPHALGRA
jgi:peptidoglycan/LPS O-acetylase OafA/YrhL